MNTTPRDQVLSDLWTEHSVWLRGYMTRRGCSVDLAEDIVAETYARAWRFILKHGDTGPGSDRAWLATIGRNLFIDMMRSKKIDPTSPIDDYIDFFVEPDSVGPGTVAESNDGTGVIIEAIENLPEPARVAVVSILFGEMRQTEVADRLGVRQSTVSKRYNNGLQVLADMPRIQALRGT